MYPCTQQNSEADRICWCPAILPCISILDVILGFFSSPAPPVPHQSGKVIRHSNCLASASFIITTTTRPHHPPPPHPRHMHHSTSWPSRRQHQSKRWRSRQWKTRYRCCCSGHRRTTTGSRSCCHPQSPGWRRQSCWCSAARPRPSTASDP